MDPTLTSYLILGIKKGNMLPKFLSCFIGITAAFNAWSDDVLISDVLSVYDADTIKVNIRAWPDIVGKSMPVRVSGIDTPEIKGKCVLEREMAVAARDFAAALLTTAQVVELRNIRRDKYFRLLAEVWADGWSLGAILLESGLARHYEGGTKTGWCVVSSSTPSLAN
jgi:endonuclease YncB( thermonuclease family)